jgi:hypothetical protein
MKRVPGPKTAKVPLWFTQHKYADEIDQIYWPVLVQYRYVSPEQEADIVMRVIFINVKEWDRIYPDPRRPPEVLRVPKLFSHDPRLPLYDVFLSYNSKDSEYVKELWEVLKRFGLKVWFDENDLMGQEGFSRELIGAASKSRIILAVLGKNKLGAWQESVELQVHLLDHCKGNKPFVLLLLPDFEGKDTWTGYLPAEMQPIFRNSLYLHLPTLPQLRKIGDPSQRPKFVERLIAFIVKTMRGPDKE